jgi:hypothetical protein
VHSNATHPLQNKTSASASLSSPPVIVHVAEMETWCKAFEFVEGALESLKINMNLRVRNVENRWGGQGGEEEKQRKVKSSAIDTTLRQYIIALLPS